jgi:hypothetical protein
MIQDLPVFLSALVIHPDSVLVQRLVTIVGGKGDSSVGVLLCFVLSVTCEVYKVLRPYCMIANAPYTSCFGRGFDIPP